MYLLFFAINVAVRWQMTLHSNYLSRVRTFRGMTVWRPHPPSGYMALGDVVTAGTEAPRYGTFVLARVCVCAFVMPVYFSEQFQKLTLCRRVCVLLCFLRCT